MTIALVYGEMTNESKFNKKNVWRDRFGLAIKGGKVGEAMIALVYMS